MTPMTEFPDDDAPLSDWLRPVSATMINGRYVPCGSTVAPTMGGGGKARGRKPKPGKARAWGKESLTDDAVETIKRMALAGETLTAIAKAVGCANSSVARHIRRLRVHAQWTAARAETKQARRVGAGLSSSGR